MGKVVMTIIEKLTGDNIVEIVKAIGDFTAKVLTENKS